MAARTAGAPPVVVVAHPSAELYGSDRQCMETVRGLVEAGVRAVVALSGTGIGEEQAYAQLRTLAMSWQVTLEEAARRIADLKRKEACDERPRRA